MGSVVQPVGRSEAGVICDHAAFDADVPTVVDLGWLIRRGGPRSTRRHHKSSHRQEHPSHTSLRSLNRAQAAPNGTTTQATSATARIGVSAGPRVSTA